MMEDAYFNGKYHVEVKSNGGFFAIPDDQKPHLNQPKSNAIVPCLSVDIMRSSNQNDVFTFPSGVEYTHVKVVGKVTSCVAVAGGRVDVRVNDGTSAPILIKNYLENDDEATVQENMLPVNEYVSVVGKVRHFQALRFILPLSIRPLKDPNELTCHLLEVLKFQRDMHRKRELQDLQEESSSLPQPQQSTSSQSPTPQKKMRTTAVNGTQAHAKAIKDRIYDFMKAQSTNRSVHIKELQHNFPNIKEDSLTAVLETLISDGHIYTTVDDEHFKVTYLW